MGRPRKSNPLNLPPRLYAHHGAFWYRPLHGKPENLGTDLDKAKRHVKALCEAEGVGYGTIAYYLPLYLGECRKRVARGDMAPRTVADYQKNATPLLAYFGHMAPAGVEPTHIAGYLDTNAELHRAVRANRERACLSAMFTWLIRAGIVAINPCRGVRRNKETKRLRYVEHDELRATMETAPMQVWALAELIYRTLQRPEDIIRWTPRNVMERIDASGRKVRIIRNAQSKSATRSNPKIVDIEISPEIDAVLNRLKSASKIRGLTLIQRRDGMPYTYSGLTAMLKRRQKTAGVAPFGYYDMKGKGATDMWLAGESLEKIQVLCGHDSVKTTERYVKGRWRGIVQANRVARG